MEETKKYSSVEELEYHYLRDIEILDVDVSKNRDFKSILNRMFGIETYLYYIGVLCLDPVFGALYVGK